MIKKFKSLTLLVFLLILSQSVYSQEAGSCAEKLQTAQALFEKGLVDQVPGMISGCLKSGFTREESLAAYKLLVQAYLLEDMPERADSVMLAFLKKNPEYEISPTDHSSFVNVFNNFNSRVLFQVSGHVGSNVPFVIISRGQSLSGVPGQKKYSTEAFNLYLSLELKFKLSKKLEVNAEAGFSQFAFSKSEIIDGFSTTLSQESQRRIELPLSATYDVFRVGKFTPYIRLGSGPALIVGTSAKTDINPLYRIPDDRPQNEISLKSRRIFMDLMIQAGGGLKYKIRQGFFFGEVRSNLGVSNQSTFKSYSGLDNDYNWFYLNGDDNFRMNSLNINFGYTRIFYKPSKKEN
ncbi:MAG: hypothetical protein ACM3NR_04155 [Methanosarcina sp.]